MWPMASWPLRLASISSLKTWLTRPRSLMHGDLAVVADRDAGALLSAVLQGVQPEEGETRHVAPRRIDAEDAAAS